jgi:hypothetical protein
LNRYRQNVRSRNEPNNRSRASNWWACHTAKGGKALQALDFTPIVLRMIRPQKFRRGCPICL